MNVEKLDLLISLLEETKVFDWDDPEKCLNSLMHFYFLKLEPYDRRNLYWGNFHIKYHNKMYQRKTFALGAVTKPAALRCLNYLKEKGTL